MLVGGVGGAHAVGHDDTGDAVGHRHVVVRATEGGLAAGLHAQARTGTVEEAHRRGVLVHAVGMAGLAQLHRDLPAHLGGRRLEDAADELGAGLSLVVVVAAHLAANHHVARHDVGAAPAGDDAHVDGHVVVDTAALHLVDGVGGDLDGVHAALGLEAGVGGAADDLDGEVEDGGRLVGVLVGVARVVEREGNGRLDLREVEGAGAHVAHLLGHHAGKLHRAVRHAPALQAGDGRHHAGDAGQAVGAQDGVAQARDGAVGVDLGVLAQGRGHGVHVRDEEHRLARAGKGGEEVAAVAARVDETHQVVRGAGEALEAARGGDGGHHAVVDAARGVLGDGEAHALERPAQARGHLVLVKRRRVYLDQLAEDALDLAQLIARRHLVARLTVTKRRPHQRVHANVSRFSAQRAPCPHIRRAIIACACRAARTAGHPPEKTKMAGEGGK